MIGGRAEVSGGAVDDLLDQRGGRQAAAVRVGVGLDDVGGRGRGLRSGRAGAARGPDARGSQPPGTRFVPYLVVWRYTW